MYFFNAEAFQIQAVLSAAAPRETKEGSTMLQTSAMLLSASKIFRRHLALNFMIEGGPKQRFVPRISARLSPSIFEFILNILVHSGAYRAKLLDFKSKDHWCKPDFIHSTGQKIYPSELETKACSAAGVCSVMGHRD